MLSSKEVLKKIGLTKINYDEFEKALVKNCEKEISDLILDEMGNRADGIQNRTFYPVKNKSLAISILISSVCDYDFYLNFLSKICKNTHWIGNTVLDIGCDCGILSCAIGLLFPNSQVIGIDRCTNAIENAKDLASKLHLTNVSFKKCSIEDIDVKPVDTVISSKVLHEIVNTDGISYDKVEFFKYSEEVAKKFKAFADLMNKIVANGGRLISLERLSLYADGFGYVSAMQKHDFVLDGKDSCVIVNQSNRMDCGKPESFPLFVYIKSTSVSVEYNPFNNYAVLCEKYGLNFHKAKYSGWEALIVFELRKDSMLFGCELFKDEKNVGDISLWGYSGDDTTIIYKTVIKNMAFCAFVDASQKDSFISTFDENEKKKEYGVDKIVII